MWSQVSREKKKEEGDLPATRNTQEKSDEC